MRIDKAISIIKEDLSRVAIQRMIDNENIKVKACGDGVVNGNYMINSISYSHHASKITTYDKDGNILDRDATDLTEEILKSENIAMMHGSMSDIDLQKIVDDLEKAKEQNPDVIVVNMHWGIEYQTSPNKEQERLANILFENGVDIILGSHPHVLQQMEKREIQLEDGTTKEGFIIYSLGNFISGQVKENTKESVILNMDIVKNGKGVA